MLTPDQKDRILAGSVVLKHDPQGVTSVFYRQLFKRIPHVQTLFSDDLTMQQEKLADTLLLLVQSVENLSAIKGTLQALGRQHIGFGVVPEQVPIIGQVLLETLALHMPDWGEADDDAWSALFGAAAEEFLAGMHAEDPRLSA